MDRDLCQIAQLICRRHMAYVDGKIQTSTLSDVLRELIYEWLNDKSLEWYPKLIREFRIQGIHTRTLTIMEKALRDYAESARINSAPNIKLEDLTSEQLRIREESLQELADLKESMLKAGFTETEYEAIIGEK